MPSLFLSHSSADKTFVEKLAKDLEGVGVNVWFDKWEIKVGDSLTGKIEEGLQANDYLGLVLSPAAVASEWVKAELSAAWCRQMSSRKIVVLPILYQDCEIPFLLEDRKYADFRTSYDEGFMALCAALGLKHSEALSENNWRLFMGDREADWKYYREQEYKRLVTRLVDRARQYNWSSWTGGTKNPLSITFSAFIDRNKEKCIALRMVKGAYMAAETDEWNPNNTKLSLYTEYIGNTVNECGEYVWREMEKFRATYGDPTGKSEHFTSRFLNDGQKLKIISEMLQKMDWYQGDMEDEKDEERGSFSAAAILNKERAGFDRLSLCLHNINQPLIAKRYFAARVKMATAVVISAITAKMPSIPCPVMSSAISRFVIVRSSLP